MTTFFYKTSPLDSNADYAINLSFQKFQSSQVSIGSQDF